MVDTVEGICNGTIIERSAAAAASVTIPCSFPDGQVKTFAELPPEVKNRISHRAKALQKAWAVLARYLREKGSP